MKKLIYFLIFCLILNTSVLASENEYAWILGGIQGGCLIGNGIADNHFNIGYGLLTELGLVGEDGLACAFGAGLYWTENVVFEDKASVTFYTPVYFDIRLFFFSDSIFNPFISVGSAWSLMQFEGTNGYNNQFQLTTGPGIHIILEPFMFQIMAKPYLVFLNDLEQNFGIEVHILLGYFDGGCASGFGGCLY